MRFSCRSLVCVTRPRALCTRGCLTEIVASGWWTGGGNRSSSRFGRAAEIEFCRSERDRVCYLLAAPSSAAPIFFGGFQGDDACVRKPWKDEVCDIQVGMLL